MTEYRGAHQPDTSDDAIPFHELDRAMPDFYNRPHDYVWDLGEPENAALRTRGRGMAVRQAMRARGNPEAQVTLYRAVPKGVSDVNTGDWVTTSEQYAREHAMLSDDPNEDMDVLSFQTPAKNITFGGNDGYEFGYIGEPQHGLNIRSH